MGILPACVVNTRFWGVLQGTKKSSVKLGEVHIVDEPDTTRVQLWHAGDVRLAKQDAFGPV